MSYTRREILQLAALTVAVPRGLFVQAPPSTTFTDLRRNVGIFTGRGGTIGWLINPGGVILVDTQFPQTATICLDGIKTRAANRGVDLVFNTHHHPDHAGGNSALRASTKKIVAHQRVPELMKVYAEKQAPLRPASAPPLPPLEFPDTLFPGTFKIDIGDEVISAKHHGPAHTGGDIVIVFERANIVHMGDLAWNRMHPFVDRIGGASVANWITLLERVSREHTADTQYIFGHAGAKWPVTGTKAELLQQRDYFTALLDYTRAKIKAGTPRDAFIKSTDTLPAFPDHGPLIEVALAGTFDEVTASK
jgi:cyclase